MLTWTLLCRLLMVQSFSSAITSAMNITWSTGTTAILPCPIPFYKNDTRIAVSWVKDYRSDINVCAYSILNGALQDQKCKPRFKVNEKPLGLAITGVEISDAGVYKCEMHKVIPPPVETRSTTIVLNVSSLTLQWINISMECLELHCSLQGVKTQRANFTWTSTYLHLNHISSNMSSTLTLCKPNWTEGDSIMCRAGYSNTFLVTSISLPCIFGDCKDDKINKQWLIITVVSTSAGLLLLILLGAIIVKCKKRATANKTIIYRNKIYENFTFSTTTINPVLSPQNPPLGARSNIRSTTSSYPQTIRQREECIYEI